jgi:hypothetical protein
MSTFASRNAEMLILDDAALARLCIAATAMPANQRGRWLINVAAEFEGKQPTAAAVRKRRQRKRDKRGGKTAFKTFHDEAVLIFALEHFGELPPGEQHTHAAIQAALQRREEDWLDGWRELYETA